MKLLYLCLLLVTVLLVTQSADSHSLGKYAKALKKYSQNGAKVVKNTANLHIMKSKRMEKKAMEESRLKKKKAAEKMEVKKRQHMKDSQEKTEKKLRTELKRLDKKGLRSDPISSVELKSILLGDDQHRTDKQKSLGKTHNKKKLLLEKLKHFEKTSLKLDAVKSLLRERTSVKHATPYMEEGRTLEERRLMKTLRRRSKNRSVEPQLKSALRKRSKMVKGRKSAKYSEEDEENWTEEKDIDVDDLSENDVDNIFENISSDLNEVEEEEYTLDSPENLDEEYNNIVEEHAEFDLPEETNYVTLPDADSSENEIIPEANPPVMASPPSTELPDTESEIVPTEVTTQEPEEPIPEPESPIDEETESSVVTTEDSPAFAETEATEPETMVSEAPELEAVVTEAPESETVVSEAPEPETVVTEAQEPEVVVTEATESEAEETEAPEPEAVVTEATIIETDTSEDSVLATDAPTSELPEIEAAEDETILETAGSTNIPTPVTAAEPEVSSYQVGPDYPWDSYDEGEEPCGRARFGPETRRPGSANQRLLKILEGKEALPGAFPWQVAILNERRGLHCGGSLIAPRWVMTAAHCVRKKLYVRLSEHHLLQKDGLEVELKVRRIFRHPDYNSSTIDNDIALLRLPAMPPFPDNVTGVISRGVTDRVCLPPANVFPMVGARCMVMGWGKSSLNSGFGTDTLMYTKLPIISDKACRKANRKTITENMFCAGHYKGGSDTCSGDSGGPLLCSDGTGGPNERWTAFGVTSFGEGCGLARKMGVYARVPNYLDWMSGILKRYL